MKITNLRWWMGLVFSALFVLSFASVGCDDEEETADSGTTPVVDSGVPHVDSGTPDVDSGTPDVDSGTPDVDGGDTDAGEEGDAGDTDAGEEGDAGGDGGA